MINLIKNNNLLTIVTVDGSFYVSRMSGNIREVANEIYVHDSNYDKEYKLGLYTKITLESVQAISKAEVLTYLSNFFSNAFGGAGIADMTKATYDPAGKNAQLAADSEVVHKTGNENISGVKTFVGFYMYVRKVITATYDILAGDSILSVEYTTTDPCALQILTSNLIAGRYLFFKDSGGNASTNNITITTEGTEKIDGEDSFVIDSDYGAVNMYCDGSNWFVF